MSSRIRSQNYGSNVRQFIPCSILITMILPLNQDFSDCSMFFSPCIYGHQQPAFVWFHHQRWCNILEGEHCFSRHGTGKLDASFNHLEATFTDSGKRIMPVRNQSEIYKILHCNFLSFQFFSYQPPCSFYFVPWIGLKKRKKLRTIFQATKLLSTKPRLVVPATYTSKTGEFSHTQHQIKHRRGSMIW